MKFKLIFSTILGLIYGTTAPAVSTQILDYSEGNYKYQKPAITGLGKSFEIRESANSWASLIEKLKPTFAWNNCDLMWVETDSAGRLNFILDEAYIYQPINQPCQWVLLDRKSASSDGLFQESPRFFYSGENFRAVATLRKSVPEVQNDAGERGNYALVLGADPRYGTVYEIGWQREMGYGTAHTSFGRRIYVLRDRSNLWHFLSEGPEDGAERGEEVIVHSRVFWNDEARNEFPLEIRFQSESYLYDDTAGEEAREQNTVNTTNEFMLGGKFPAHLRKIQ